MKAGRRFTQVCIFILDELLPPILRDRRWFMWPLNWLLFRSKANHFLDFKERAPRLDHKEIRFIYQQTASVHIQRETDLNSACISAIENSIKGKSVLDAGCGHGFLARRLAKNYQVTALDFMIDSSFPQENQVALVRGDVEALPFLENSFDTVVCTHTLEHLRDLRATMSSLRRIAKERLIIVVPLQRPYKYTFDLHLQFFPYPHSFLIQAGPGAGKVSTREVGGELFYMEDNP